MPDTGTGRLLATNADLPFKMAIGIPTVVLEELTISTQCPHREPDRRRDRKGRINRTRLLSQRLLLEQWVCFLLGIVSIDVGIWGLCMKCSADSLPADIAWLGSVYVPTLRVTAAVCFVRGTRLVRRDGRGPDRSAIRRTEDDDDLFLETGLAIWMLPRHSADSSRLRGQVVKGGKQVRRDTENYRTAYLMCVLYAFVVIVLAVVFLL
jgi:hypothetical protein